MEKEFYNQYFSNLTTLVSSVDKDCLEEVVSSLDSVFECRNKVILVGNGGSAAMASHVAVDLTKAAGIRAINFNEADLITCFANDYGYENWVVEALKAYADPGDLLVLISSSGRSKNIINAADYAKNHGLNLVTFSGFDADNPLRQYGKVNFWANSGSYNLVEMTHHIWLLAIVDAWIERKSK